MLLSRRAMIATGLATAAAPLLARAAPPPPSRLLIDGLGGLDDPYAPDGQLALSPRAVAEIRASGVHAVNQTLLPVGNRPRAWEELLESLAQWDKILAANPATLLPIRKLADFARARAEGKLGIWFGVQDTSMVGTQLNRLAEMKARGLRQIQLTYNLRNLSGDGSLEPDNAGLSLLGRKTVARIEAERLVLDLSHGGARTQREAIGMATRPPLISHTGCRALHDHPRNTHDATMKLVADKGGCVGIYFMPYLAPGSHPTGDDLIAHIEHAANVCGEDHVSIGTDGGVLPLVIDDKARAAARADFAARSAAGIAAPGEGPDVFTIVADYNSLDKFDRLALALSRRGWSGARIDKLYGANLLRVYSEVWD
ncbi:MAG: membrane dipeptidase [Proteobacteria bacterium]|nr:membrane dipeptidase [Pseudomonadota bacterium]